MCRTLDRGELMSELHALVERVRQSSRDLELQDKALEDVSSGMVWVGGGEGGCVGG